MKKFLSFLVISAAGTGVACGGVSTEPTGDILSEAELAVVTNAIIGVALDAGVGKAEIPTQPALLAPPFSFNVPLDQTVECGDGGTMQIDGSLSGEVDTDTGNGTIDLNFTQTPSSCSIETEQGVFLINGDPNMVLDGSMSWGPNGPIGTSTFTYTGGFSWSQGDRTGTCGIDLELTVSGESGSYTGSVCGQNFDTSVGVG